MIKCNVTVVGKVFRNSELKEDRNGNPFVTFGLSVCLKDGDESKDIDISVASDGDDNFVLGLSAGDRVKVEGVLTFKRRDDVVFYNLSAGKVTDAGSEEDSITGDILFRGTLSGKDIPEKKGKKGGYRIFDAFSTEKIDEEKYSYTWVHFIDFSGKRAECLAPRARIQAEGDLELQVYNGKVSINCRVKSVEPWEKDNANS